MILHSYADIDYQMLIRMILFTNW